MIFMVKLRAFGYRFVWERRVEADSSMVALKSVLREFARADPLAEARSISVSKVRRPQ